MKTFTIIETTQKTSEIMQEMRSLFKVWSYLSDDEFDKQFPPPQEIATREFLYSVEPDPATLGKSAREADPDMKGITLRERMLLEIQYFKETRNHLDIKGWTICSGSRNSDGGVPCMGLGSGSGEVSVYWYGVDDSDPEFGLRQAVSTSSLIPPTLVSAIKICKENGLTVTKIY